MIHQETRYKTRPFDHLNTGNNTASQECDHHDQQEKTDSACDEYIEFTNHITPTFVQLFIIKRMIDQHLRSSSDQQWTSISEKRN